MLLPLQPVKKNGVYKSSLKTRLKALTSNAIYGVDNTGNVRVWAAEQCLLHTILHVDSFRERFVNKHVLELGAGLSGLCGLGISVLDLCSSVHITDGHPLCVKNIEVCISLKEAIEEMKQSTYVKALQLKWGSLEDLQVAKDSVKAVREICP